MTYVGNHGEPNEERQDADAENEELLALAATQQVRVDVNNGRHETLHAHKLKSTNTMYVQCHVIYCGITAIYIVLMYMRVAETTLLTSHTARHAVTRTWLSRPSRMTMKKKSTAHTGDSGICATALG